MKKGKNRKSEDWKAFPKNCSIMKKMLIEVNGILRYRYIEIRFQPSVSDNHIFREERSEKTLLEDY